MAHWSINNLNFSFGWRFRYWLWLLGTFVYGEIDNVPWPIPLWPSAYQRRKPSATWSRRAPYEGHDPFAAASAAATAIDLSAVHSRREEAAADHADECAADHADWCMVGKRPAFVSGTERVVTGGAEQHAGGLRRIRPARGDRRQQARRVARPAGSPRYARPTARAPALSRAAARRIGSSACRDCQRRACPIGCCTCQR